MEECTMYISLNRIADVAQDLMDDGLNPNYPMIIMRPSHYEYGGVQAKEDHQYPN